MNIEHKESISIQEKIENIKTNLLEYFDSEYIKGLYNKGKNYTTIERKDKSGNTYFYYSGRECRCENGKYFLNKGKGETEITKKIYTKQLQKGNDANKTNQMKKLKKMITNLNKYIEHSDKKRKKNIYSLRAAGAYNSTKNKIQVPSNVTEATLVHEVMHLLQHNFYRIQNLLDIHDQEMTEVSDIIWGRYVEEYKKNYKLKNNIFRSMLTKYKKKLSLYKKKEKKVASLINLEDQKNIKEQIQHIIRSEQGTLSKTFSFTYSNIAYDDSDQLKEKLQKTLQDIKYGIADIERKISLLSGGIVKDPQPNPNSRDMILSDKEFHSRLFDLKYSCMLYLTPPVKLGDSITINHIKQLMTNKAYLKDHEKTYDFINYLAYITKEIETLDDAITKQKDEESKQSFIEKKTILIKEKSNVLIMLLDLANNDLVYQGTTNRVTPPNIIYQNSNTQLT